jgi:hypothetical protein
MIITAKIEPSETGLARVCQGPRGYHIKVDGKRAGSVGCAGRSSSQWFFWVREESLGIPLHNTVAAGLPYWPSREDAKAACIAHIKSILQPTKG